MAFIVRIGPDTYRIQSSDIILEKKHLDEIYSEALIYDSRVPANYRSLIISQEFASQFRVAYEEMFGAVDIQYHWNEYRQALYLGTLFLDNGVSSYFNILKTLLVSQPYRFASFSTIPIAHYPHIAELYDDVVKNAISVPRMTIKL